MDSVPLLGIFQETGGAAETKRAAVLGTVLPNLSKTTGSGKAE